jgi:hypothetical protein
MGASTSSSKRPSPNSRCPSIRIWRQHATPRRVSMSRCSSRLTARPSPAGASRTWCGPPSTPRVYQRAAWRTVGSGALGGIGFGLALGPGTSVFGAAADHEHHSRYAGEPNVIDDVFTHHSAIKWIIRRAKKPGVAGKPQPADCESDPNSKKHARPTHVTQGSK